MKIINVRTHEAVTLGKKLDTNFTAYNRGNRKAVEIELLPELMAVQISSQEDCVIVPLVNIAFLKPETKYSRKKEEAAKKEAEKPKVNPKESKVSKPR